MNGNSDMLLKEEFIEVSLSRQTSNTSIGEHTHPFHELYFLVSGKVKYFITNEIFEASERDLVFVNKNHIHTTSYSGNAERILVSFNDAFLGKQYKEFIKKSAETKHFVLSSERQDEIEKVVRKLYLEYKNKEDNYIFMCKNLLRQLLILMSREDVNLNKENLNGTPLVIQNAAKYITANFNENLTLDSLSRRFAMSPSYFSKSFKQFTGLGLNEYITAVRVSNAKKMLKNTSLTVTEVSSRCGFNDSNYFATVFKKLNGVSPKRYSKEK